MPEYESATVPEGTMKLVTEASRHWLAVPGLLCKVARVLLQSGADKLSASRKFATVQGFL